jgi:hypothetical protein
MRILERASFPRPSPFMEAHSRRVANEVARAPGAGRPSPELRDGTTCQGTKRASRKRIEWDGLGCLLLVLDRVSLLIKYNFSPTHGAGAASCRHPEKSFFHDAGMVTRLVSPLSPLFFLHRQKCCSLHDYPLRLHVESPKFHLTVFSLLEPFPDDLPLVTPTFERG